MRPLPGSCGVLVHRGLLFSKKKWFTGFVFDFMESHTCLLPELIMSLNAPMDLVLRWILSLYYAPPLINHIMYIFNCDWIVSIYYTQEGNEYVKFGLPIMVSLWLYIDPVNVNVIIVFVAKKLIHVLLIVIKLFEWYCLVSGPHGYRKFK